jgi:hypothetical protein
MSPTENANISDKPEQTKANEQLSQRAGTSLQCFLALSLFLGIKKGVLDYFKVCSLSNNSALGNVCIPFGVLILLACIRTVPSTLLKLKRILEKRKQVQDESSEEEVSEGDSSSSKKYTLTQSMVFAYLFIAVAINFTAAHKTFNASPMVIYGIMLAYASAASTYEGIKFAKPLIERLSNCIMDAIFGDIQAKEIARARLYQIFWANKRKYKFMVISLGAITTSFFMIYSVQSALGVITHPLLSLWNISDTLTSISLYLAIFLTILHIIPYYAVTFREEADHAFAKKQDEKQGRITPTFRQLFERTKVKGECRRTFSLVVFGFFAAISIAFWFACAGIISIGAYIGALSFFGNVWVGRAVFIIDFFHVLFYYDTEVSRIMLNGLMQLPVINLLFSTLEVKQKPLETVDVTDQSETSTPLLSLHPAIKR